MRRSHEPDGGGAWLRPRYVRDDAITSETTTRAQLRHFLLLVWLFSDAEKETPRSSERVHTSVRAECALVCVFPCSQNASPHNPDRVHTSTPPECAPDSGDLRFPWQAKRGAESSRAGSVHSFATSLGHSRAGISSARFRPGRVRSPSAPPHPTGRRPRCDGAARRCRGPSRLRSRPSAHAARPAVWRGAPPGSAASASTACPPS